MTPRIREAFDEWIDADLRDRFVLDEPSLVSSGVRRFRIPSESVRDAAVNLTVFSRNALRLRGLDASGGRLLAIAREATHPSVQRLLGVGHTDRLRWCTDVEPAAHLAVLANPQVQPRTLEELLDLGESIASAVDAVHARGIPHAGLDLAAIHRAPDGAVMLRPPGVDRLVAAVADATIDLGSPSSDRAALASLLLALLPASAAEHGSADAAAPKALFAILREGAAGDADTPATDLSAFLKSVRAAVRARPAGPRRAASPVLDGDGVVSESVASDLDAGPRRRARAAAPSVGQPLLMVGPPLRSLRGPMLVAIALLAGLVALPVLHGGAGLFGGWGWAFGSPAERVSLPPLERSVQRIAEHPVVVAADSLDRGAFIADTLAPPLRERSTPPAAPVRPARPARAERQQPAQSSSSPSLNTRRGEDALRTEEWRPPELPLSGPSIVEVPRVPSYGHITVSARPWAYVYVDDSLVGHTPLARLAIAAGRRQLRLERAGFRAHTASLDVRPGETVQLLDVVLPREVP